MPERPKDLPKEFASLVEQSVSTLQEVDRRLQVVRSDLAALIAQAGGPPLATHRPGMPGPLGGIGPGAPAWSATPAAGFPPPGAAPGAPWSGAVATPPSAPAPRTVKELLALAPVPRMPALNVLDAGREFVLEVELPGVRKEDLDITVADRTVTLQAHRKPSLHDGALVFADTPPVVYHRQVPLPGEVLAQQSRATFKDGVLTLTIAKKDPAQGPHRPDVAYL